MQVLGMRFGTAELCTALNMPVQTLHSYHKRGYMVGNQTSGGGKRGARKLFTWHDVMHVAMARALIDAGMSDPVPAFLAARDFAHTSGEDHGTDAPMRLPGLPWHFSRGQTLFAVGGGRTAEMAWDPNSRRNPYLEFFAKFGGLRGPEGFVVLDASRVFDRVAASLGAHPGKVLDAAYPKNAR